MATVEIGCTMMGPLSRAGFGKVLREGNNALKAHFVFSNNNNNKVSPIKQTFDLILFLYKQISHNVCVTSFFF